MPPPETCPNCGADVPRNARACPECGSDESTGWSEEAHREHLGLPDENFDYEEFVANEFGEPGPGRVKPRSVGWMWWVVGILLVLVVLSWFFR